MYRKPGNSEENSNGIVHPGENFSGKKSNTFRGINLFARFFPKRPKFFVTFVWLTSARPPLREEGHLF